MNNDKIAKLLNDLSSDDRQAVFCAILAKMEPNELARILVDTFDHVEHDPENRELVVRAQVFAWKDGNYHDVPETSDERFFREFKRLELG